MEKLKITEMKRLTAEQYRQQPKTPLVVVMDNVRSLHNIGSVFRTADAFLLQKILLCGISGTPPNAEIHKTALGAEFSVNWEYFENTEDAVIALKQAGYIVFSAEQAKGSVLLGSENLKNLFSEKTGEKYAVVFGNEVKGVQQSIVDICDGCIEIPQFGTKHSLNVSVSAGIVIWEIFRLLT